MYIKELHVDGYGALSGVKLRLDAPVTVIYGPNEAGKSTLLRFVRSMLYGFPTRKEPVERGEPVLGGRHGGRLLLADKSGQEWLLERYAERGSEVTVRDPGGMERAVRQAEWQRMLLGGISEQLFRQLFSVSLNELNELRTLQGEEVGNYLYHAGLAGGSAITSASRRLGAEMDRLYRPKGTTQEMNRLLVAIKETEAAIRQGRDGIHAYLETKGALARVEHLLLSMEEGIPELRRETAKLQGAFELREWWLKREMLLTEDAELRDQLREPSTVLLREDTALRWAELKKDKYESSSRLAVARNARTELLQLREKLTWQAEWVNVHLEWERLESMREAITAKREERAELEAERRTLEETISSILSRVSATWGEAELLTFGGMAAEREQIRKVQQSWEEEEKAAIALQAEMRRLARQQEVVQSEDNLADEYGIGREPADGNNGSEFSFGYFVPRTRAALLQAWHGLEDARRDYERSRSSVRSPRSTASRVNSKAKRGSAPGYAIAGLLGAIAIALPIGIGLSLSRTVPLFVYFLSSVLLLAAGAVIFVSRRNFRQEARGGSDDAFSASAEDDLIAVRFHHKQMNDRLRQLVQHAETAASRLLPELPESLVPDMRESQHTIDAVWQQLRTAVHEQLGRLEESDRLRDKQQELQNRVQELRMERDLVERDALEQRSRMNQLQTNWKQWLASKRLPPHLTPDSLPELFGIAEQGQAALRQRQRVAERSQSLQAAIREFEQTAVRLIEICSTPTGIPADIVQAVQGLYKESKRHVGLKNEAEQLEGQLALIEATVEEEQALLANIDIRIADLFREAHVGSEAELESRLRIEERSLALRKEAREIQLRLESGRDSEEQSRLYELLRAYDEASLTSLLRERKDLLIAEEARRTELLDQRGRLTQELDRQRSEAELEDHGQRLRELQAKLERLTERYAVLAIGERLIVQTKAVFEEEKQPEVLQRASRYFRRMTNDAYVRIVAPGDSKTLFAETPDRRSLDSAFLSRGTQEQLYLAMRFALCDAASPEHPLPLLLDDLFVHFDEQRLTQALPVLSELANSRQIVLFTCHRYMARTIASGIPSVRILSLGEQEV
ncbi:AAA family ATPase [Cohnella herbarum]|uniref:AAA family ATPase n=1 Tax=Cohnella herbarum TaxID=2728023 RepID=A0A7Z2ZJ72_9BACL|nr:AAA family ATPase [Cohnella herbarum]QJD81891.1 AAA family ATPase [Cohnella herbarum]